MSHRVTPNSLAQTDGVLAVFVGLFVEYSDHARWRQAAIGAMRIADDLTVDDLTVHVGDAQTIRLLAVDDLQCVVVYRSGHHCAKSMPRSMRRCIAYVRDERRRAETEVVVGPSKEAPRPHGGSCIVRGGEDGP